MKKRFTRILPIVIAVGAGFGLVAVGRAMHGDISNDWLAFSGSLIGNGVAALVGYWLIRLQEDRGEREKRGMIAASLNLIEEHLQKLKAAAKLTSDAQITPAVDALRMSAKTANIALNHVGVINVETLAAVELLRDELNTINWDGLIHDARYVASLKIYSDSSTADQETTFDRLVDGLLPLVERARATLK